MVSSKSPLASPSYHKKYAKYWIPLGSFDSVVKISNTELILDRDKVKHPLALKKDPP